MPVEAPSPDAIRAARARLADLIVQTPIWRWRGDEIERAAGTQPLLQLELFPHAGSFKPRGALTVMLHLSPEAPAPGVTAGRPGQHAPAGRGAGRRARTTRQRGGSAEPQPSA